MRLRLRVLRRPPGIAGRPAQRCCDLGERWWVKWVDGRGWSVRAGQVNLGHTYQVLLIIIKRIILQFATLSKTAKASLCPSHPTPPNITTHAPTYLDSPRCCVSRAPLSCPSRLVSRPTSTPCGPASLAPPRPLRAEAGADAALGAGARCLGARWGLAGRSLGPGLLRGGGRGRCAISVRVR